MAELKGADRFDYEVVKLMRLMDTGDMMLQMFEMGMRFMIPQLQAEDSDFPADEFIERVQQRLDIDSLLFQMVPLYTRYYTREEISGLISFHETPLGSKSTNVLPQIAQESMAIFQTFFQAAWEKATNEME